MNMPNISTQREEGFHHFGIDKKDIALEEQNRIAQALVLQGIDPSSDAWDVAHWEIKSSGKKRILSFSDESKRHKLKLGWFKNYAKYLIAKKRIDEAVHLSDILSTYGGIRKFADFMIRLDCHDIDCLTRDMIYKYEGYILKSSLADGTKHSRLRYASYILSALGITFEWSPIHIQTYHTTTELYFKNQKKKRPPLEVILQYHAIAKQLISEMDEKIARSVWTLHDTFDLFAVGLVILMIGTYSRINEVMYLSTDCEYFGDGSWTPTMQGEQLPQYGLIMYIEKPKRAYIKPVVPEYAAIVHEVIKAIMKVTDINRRYVKYWEEHGHIRYVLKKTQKLSECLFCFYDNRGKSKYRLSEAVLELLEKGEMMSASGFGMNVLGGSRAFMINKLRSRLGNGFARYRKYPVAQLCKDALGTGRLYTSGQLTEHMKTHISVRYQLRHDEKIYLLNPHQLRHFTTTVMKNAGIEANLVDRLHGRSSTGQSIVYDHPTDSELYQRSCAKNEPRQLIAQIAEIDKYDFTVKPLKINCDVREDILGLFRRELVIGPKAKAYQLLIKKHENGEVSMEEFKYMEWQYFPMIIIAPIRLGLCTHSWYENPCRNHYNCLLDDYGDICKSLSPFVHPHTEKICEQIQRDLELSLELAKKRSESEYRNRWLVNLETKILHSNQIKSEVSAKLDAINRQQLDSRILMEDKDEKKDI